VLDTNDKGRPSLGASMDEWDWMDKRMDDSKWDGRLMIYGWTKG